MRLAFALLIAIALTPASARAQTCHVIVTVDDGDGVVVGAVVMLRDRRRILASGTTDGTGTVTLEVAPGNYLVQASATGMVTSKYSTAEIEPVVGDVSVGLKLWPTVIPDDSSVTIHQVAPSAVGEIRGQVRTADGVPVGGATVEAQGYRVGIVRDGKTVSGPDGRYRLRVPPDTYDLKAQNGEAAPPRIGADAPETWDYYPVRFLQSPVSVTSGVSVRATDLELTHVRAARVTVTVRDPAGRVPRSAAVMFSSTPRAISSVAKEAGEFSTDADGAVRLGPLLPGVLVLHARAVDTAPGLVGSTVVVVDGEPLDVSLALSTAASISGRVDFEGRTTPLHGPGGLRVVESIDGQSFGVTTANPRGTVDADGAFRLDGLFDGACVTLWGIASGWRLASIDLSGENYLNRPLPLASGQALTGVILHVVPAPADAGDRGGSCRASTPSTP